MEATAPEFAFVEALPKRERSRLGKLIDAYREFKSISETHGMLVPARVAAKLIDVSHQRVTQLVNEGKVHAVYFAGHCYIVESSLWAYANGDRSPGKRYKDVTLKDCIDAAKGV